MQGLVVLAIVMASQPPASAQTTRFSIRDGKIVQKGGGSGKLQLSESQRLMFQASRYLMTGNYQMAESLYSQAIALDSGNIQAYLQRGLARRELKDEQGTASDGSTAVTLANAGLQQNPRDGDMYYHRSMGYRLLKQFAQARQDMQLAIQLSGKSQWQTDLKAIDLEQKIAQQQY